MHYQRLQTLVQDHSLMLFGARGVGKSSLLQELFDCKHQLYLNLLDPLEEARFMRNPNELISLVEAMPSSQHYVIIDEIQKVPKLLDVVHLLIEQHPSQKIFILTGSSARKLKTAGVNLLAGRAFVFQLYPFSYLELADDFNLAEALAWGMLPRIHALKTPHAKKLFLQAYAQTYLKEEVWNEHLIRKLEPFQRFLEVAAQSNGKILNYANVAKDVGVSDKVVKNYFSILEDTLLGVILEPFQHSFRKRLKQSPKFYFIDVGIARAIARMLSLPPKQGNSYYGELFEQFIVLECYKLANYFQSEYKFSYLMTESGIEIDLVVERPGQSLLLIEIKSTTQVRDEHVKHLVSIAKELGECELVCFAREPRKRRLGDVMIYPWQEGIANCFLR